MASLAQVDKLQAKQATTPIKTMCYKSDDDEEASEECYAPSGARTNNRQVLPINDRTIFLSSTQA